MGLEKAPISGHLVARILGLQLQYKLASDILLVRYYKQPSVAEPRFYKVI